MQDIYEQFDNHYYAAISAGMTDTEAAEYAYETCEANDAERLAEQADFALDCARDS